MVDLESLSRARFSINFVLIFCLATSLAGRAGLALSHQGDGDAAGVGAGTLASLVTPNPVIDV